MHSALSILAIGSLGNMEILVILILVSILIGVPLLVVLFVWFVMNKGKTSSSAPPPSSPLPDEKEKHQADPQTTIRNDDSES